MEVIDVSVSSWYRSSHITVLMKTPHSHRTSGLTNDVIKLNIVKKKYMYLKSRTDNAFGPKIFFQFFQFRSGTSQIQETNYNL